MFVGRNLIFANSCNRGGRAGDSLVCLEDYAYTLACQIQTIILTLLPEFIQNLPVFLGDFDFCTMRCENDVQID